MAKTTYLSCLAWKILIIFLLCLSVSRTNAAWALPYYQLRDVSGERNTVAGSQWFAIVREAIWQEQVPVLASEDTKGGEAPEVTLVTSADLSRFSSVYLGDTQYSDNPGFDPIQSVYLVITQGRGDLKLDFGNHYAALHSSGEGQDVMEDVLLSVPDYTTRVVPNAPQLVASRDRLSTEMRFQANSPSYGSSLGYLTFRQSASLDYGFEGYQESIKIPLVVANVFDGMASEPGNELYFDMTVLNGNEVVTRRKFRWGVDQDVTHDFGTFFMIQPPESASPKYSLLTKITNRTGTRYRSQRYDAISASHDVPPSYWTYDLTPDLYGSLPASFQLDPQSQIAPGLVTVYSHLMDMTYGSSESFRLYPYQDPAAPRDLRLTYRKVGGMTAHGAPISSHGSSTTPAWSLTGFAMTFVDAAQDAENTHDEIAKYVGGNPTMPTSADFSGVADSYIKADAFNAFTISTDVSAASDDVPLLPVHVRLRISRKEVPLVDRWDDIANADNVINAFANVCAVWVRSPNAAELDMNLFTTLRDRGSPVDQHVQAFTHEDFVYLDFIVLLADAASQNTGKTAFCQVVEDDKIPYALIGDGKVDGKLNLSFYVAPNAASDSPESPSSPEGSSEASKTGCQGFGVWGFMTFLLLLLLFLKRDTIPRSGFR